MDSFRKAVESAVTAETGQPFVLAHTRPIGGGCIHRAAKISGEDGRCFFLKRNQIQHKDAFAAESTALRILAESGPVRFPRPVGIASTRTEAALILEFLPLGGASNEAGFQSLGTQLARLHQHSHPQFGWASDNYIGASPQLNTWSEQWIPFLRDFRLLPQIRWARRKGLPLQEADSLLDQLPAFFPGGEPAPSLLHGDLWAGNAAFLQEGSPVLFDPASYYGDREADLAMTEMFGGFPKAFYDAYHAEWPIPNEYSVRKDLYNLYHLLNHFNLFGGGYGDSANQTIRSLLSSVR